MINCKDVDKLITSDQIPSLPWLKRFEVRLHLLMCTHCSAVMKQLESVRASARNLWEISGQPESGQDTGGLESRMLHRLTNQK